MNIEQIAQEVQDSLEVNGFAYVSNREAVEFLRRCLSKLAEQVGEPVAWVCWLDGDTEMNPSDAAITRYEPTTYKNRAKLYTEAQLIAASQAREMRLREALIGLYRLDEIEHQRYSGDGDVCSEVQLAREVIATPSDTVALEALIAKAGEVMRKRCERESWLMAPVFRSIPGVTMEDLK